ncbi:MAG: NADH-ubiquinone oxidoreductase-F iron-sulfur binding region domain-containing protein [Nitriliruptoraceae bacterium]
MGDTPATGDAGKADGSRLLPSAPLTSLDAYIAAGGGRGLHTALEMAPDDVVGMVEQSKLRGRGGAGFPTGTKWRSVREAAAETGCAPQLAVNGAEGEPGTYKDRRLIADNPFLVIEGTIIARHAVGAAHAYIAVKERSGQAAMLRDAISDVVDAGWDAPDALQVIEGPDEYLFGEETALIEVIEGNLPLPRWLPPFQQGLFATTARPNPTVVNNVETLANLPLIVGDGPDAFRRAGTTNSPGTMLFTVVGDIATPGVFELPLGTPLRELIIDIAGASELKAVFSGVSAPVIIPEQLDTPLTYEDMEAAGIAIGSGGFIVYDHRHCVVGIAIALSNFLAVESCGQCTACKLGCTSITDLLRTIEAGDGTEQHLAALRDRLPGVTDQARCALPAGEQLVVGSLLEVFHDEFTKHLGRPCPSTITERVPKIDFLDDTTGEVAYDASYHRKLPDWSYAQD